MASIPSLESPSTSLLTKPCKPRASLLLKSLLVSAVVAAFAFTIISNPNREQQRPRLDKKLPRPIVILISADGFRFGYQFKTPTPNIHRLIENGTSADTGMMPVFPSITFPNHYSLATGLYPAYHGIVNNGFVDPETGDKFSTSRHEPKWWLGEPLWETVANHGYNASVINWPGCETLKGSWTCPREFCPKFNSSTPFEDSVDSILGYFDLPDEEMPILTAFHLNEPDAQGHKYGPDHPEITKAVAKVDAAIGRLIAGLEERGIFEEVTVIFVGDHGMAITCANRYIFLEDLAPWITIPSSWVHFQYQVLGIQPPSNVSAAEVVAKMNEALSSGNVTNGDKLKVYLKEDLPARFHYSESDRIPSIVGLAEESYSVEISESQGKECSGVHGYDNELFSMRSIFVGHGPRFPKGRKVPTFVNVELYNIVTNILEMKGAPNNGSASFADSFLLASDD